MSDKGTNRPDETQLLRQAREFDQGALTLIYHTYHDAIYRYIYHHLGNAQTSQDLASDVFRRLLQAMRNGGGPTKQLSAWLYRVAHNLFVDELRRRQHRNHEPLDKVDNVAIRDTSASLDELVGAAIATSQVREALLELTQEQRQVIVLKFLESRSNAEVASIMNKTVGAVKALQHRGLATLRDQFTNRQERQSPMRLGQGRVMAAHSTG